MNRILAVIGKSTLALGLLLMYGCMSVDYVGQSFPALTEKDSVKLYWSTAQVPEDTYQVIGRVMIDAPDGTTQSDVADELIELARKHGAEAVNILEYKRINIGKVAAVAEQPHRVGWNRDDRNSGGAYIYSNYFGKTTVLGGEYTKVTELKIKAVLLVSAEKVKAMQQLHKKEQKKAVTAAKGKSFKAQTAGEALDKSVKPLEVSPLKPFQAEPKPERQPSRVELSADHRPAVSL